MPRRCWGCIRSRRIITSVRYSMRWTPPRCIRWFPIYSRLAAGWGSRLLPRGEQQRVAHAGWDPLLLLAEDSLPVLLDPAPRQRLGDILPFGADAGRGQAGL